VVKNTPLDVVFSFLSSVFRNVVKNSVSCLIHYIDFEQQNLHRHRKEIQILKSMRKKQEYFMIRIKIQRIKPFATGEQFCASDDRI